MSKFHIGNMVKIDDMSKVYHGCVGNVVAIVKTGSSAEPIYEIGGVDGHAFPVRVSEENLVLVSSGYGLGRQEIKYAEAGCKICVPRPYATIRKIEGRDDILVPKIRNVILNDPAVIVLWEDGTKTVVKAQGEKFDPEKGLAMAISKKAFGNKSSYYGVFLKNIPGLKKKGAK